ncbi:MAG: class I SAM-dependent methyltransferase [Nonlabens sp.]|nr:class I SAM-dependent methyltransferase [Nonlabens sp.]
MNFSKHFLSLKDYFLSQESFELWQDEASGLLKTIPQPDNLDQYYESDAYLSHDDSDSSFFARCYNAVKVLNLRSKTKLVQKYHANGKVFDIGAGVGDLVQSLQKSSIQVVGYEPSQRAREAAQKKGVQLLKSYPTTQQDYSLITMYHVLEHVPDIGAQLRLVNSLLKPDGHLILALPNYKSFDARYFKKFWAGYDVPRHLYHFDRKAVQAVCKKYFEVVETQPMWFDSFYVSILSAQYKKIPAAFVGGVLIGLWSNLTALFSKEPSSITYILKKRV